MQYHSALCHITSHHFLQLQTICLSASSSISLAVRIVCLSASSSIGLVVRITSFSLQIIYLSPSQPHHRSFVSSSHARKDAILLKDDDVSAVVKEAEAKRRPRPCREPIRKGARSIRKVGIGQLFVYSVHVRNYSHCFPACRCPLVCIGVCV